MSNLTPPPLPARPAAAPDPTVNHRARGWLDSTALRRPLDVSMAFSDTSARIIARNRLALRLAANTYAANQSISYADIASLLTQLHWRQSSPA